MNRKRKTSRINLYTIQVLSASFFTHTPEDVSDTEDAERLAGVGSGSGSGRLDARDDGAVTLHPDVASAPHQHPVPTADRLTLQTHCRIR